MRILVSRHRLERHDSRVIVGISAGYLHLPPKAVTIAHTLGFNP